MKKIYALFLFVLLISINGFAQNARSVKGSVVDTVGKPIQNIRVKLVSTLENVTVPTNAEGVFTFPSVKSAKFQLTVTLIGYETFTKDYALQSGTQPVTLDPIILKEAVNQLEAVTIVGVVPVKVSEDTLEFSPPPVQEGDAVEETLKKIPGVTVDKDGNVTTEGKPITKITVNGKDFFGDDVATAIQNLPAEVVQSLQIIDDYGDEAKLTGIKSEEPNKVLNIKIRPDKNKGYFAYGSIGKGNEDRYSGSLRGNTMKGDQQISLESFIGNVNSRGNGAGNGLTNTKTVNLNYRDEWGKKISANGSYRFSNRDNTTVGSTFSQNIFSARTDDQTQNNNSVDFNHNFNWNFDYRIDTLNFLKVTPSLSFNSSEDTNLGFTTTSVTSASSVRDSRSLSNSKSPNMGLNVNYNHKFMKRGRNFNLFANINSSKQDQDRDTRNTYTNVDSLSSSTTITDQSQYIGTNNATRRNGIRVSYNEPLTPTSFISFNYSLNHSHTDNVRSVYDINSAGQQIFNPLVSNNYQYQFITNRIGLNYRVVKPAYNYTVGIAAQPVELRGHDISRNTFTNNKTFNWIPNARFVYKFAGRTADMKNQLTFNYNGRSNQPGFSQLQPITDNSNLQNTIVGNPDLKPEFINNMNLQLNKNNNKTGFFMNANIQYNQTKDKIVTIRQYTGTQQQTSYTNADGFYNIAGFYSLTQPFAQRKYTITYSGNGNYNNNVAFNNNERNVAKNLQFNQALRFRFDINSVMDGGLNTSYNVNTTQYSSASSEDRRTQTMRLGLNGRNFFKDLTIGYDFSKVINKGYTGGINQNPTLLNVWTEYKFLKGNMARLRLQGYDLFNQNTGISRSVSGDQITDSQYNQLGRYFLLSLSVQIRKFAGGVNPNANRQGNPGQNGRPGQGGPGGQRPGGPGGQRPGGGFGGGR